MGNENAWPGLVLGEEIGAGSYGRVYRAEINGREYALKRICVPGSPEEEKDLIRKLGGQEEAKAYCRRVTEDLLREVQILWKLRDDPHIVRVLEYRVQEMDVGCRIECLMECLEPFPEYLARHTMREEEAIRLGIELCSAQESCARENIVHGDLKPDNILVAEDGTFKISDFGEARVLEKTLLTASVRGTFSYMSPEVYHGRKSDARADLYSLGLILYRAMNHGKEPFLDSEQRVVSPREKEEAFNRRMDGEPFPPPSEASPGLGEIILKACAYYPEKRYENAASMKKDLIRLKSGAYRARKKAGAAQKKYGKRQASDYIRIAVLVFLVITGLSLAGGVALYQYREQVVNYCDADMQKSMEEEFGLSLTARLNGNGVLFIDSMDDLYCRLDDGMYPWSLQKDRIRKIVFGENVVGAFAADDVEKVSVYYPRYSLENVVIMSREDVRLAFSPGAFQNCRNLKEVWIQSREFRFVSSVSFQGCRNLVEIHCPEDADIEIGGADSLMETAWYSAEDWQVLGKTLVRYNGSEAEPEDMPEFTRIAPSAFAGNTEIRNIVLPEGTESIGKKAFSECTSLESVAIPESVTRIENGAFENCTSLKAVVIPERVSFLGDNAFHGCSGLRQLIVQPGNQSYGIEDGVLYSRDPKKLIWCPPSVQGNLVIQNDVAVICMMAFSDAYELAGIEIPETTGTESTSLFGMCPELSEIHVADANPVLSEDCGFLMTRDGMQLVLASRKISGPADVPDGIKVIQAYAFACCERLTGVHLPDTLGYILDHAFEGCSGLTEIVLPGTLNLISEQAFSGCSGLKNITFGGTREAWERITRGRDLGWDEETVTIYFEAE